MMMMKSVFWWRNPEYPEETTDLQQGMAVHSVRLLGGGVVRGSEGHPADDDNLASEKGHLLAKMALYSTITGGGQLPPPPARYGPTRSL